MTIKEYNEMLEELISNLESEIRINKEALEDTNEISDEAVKESLAYVLDCSNIEVSEYDINLIK